MGERIAGVADFDVIIVNYRTYDGLKRALDSLLQWERSFIRKILIIDNDPDEEVILSFPQSSAEPKIEWLPQNKNLGFSKAVNIGLRVSQAEYVMLLNPDAYLTSSLLQNVKSIFDKDPKIAVIGPLVLDEDGAVQHSARWDPSPLTGLFGRTGLLTKWFPKSKLVMKDLVLDHHTHNPKEVDWVSGACMLVRRSAIDEVGLLDERFFMYWEDCDWCKRFRQNGYKVVYAPQVGAVVHTCGEASKKQPIRSKFHFHKSAFLLYSKYDSSPARIGTVFAFIGCSLRFLFVIAVSSIK